MKRLVTESGAEYLWDEVKQRFKRETGPEVVNRKVEDGEWIGAFAPRAPFVGYPMVWYIELAVDDVKMRVTSNVVSIEEVTPPLLATLEG